MRRKLLLLAVVMLVLTVSAMTTKPASANATTDTPWNKVKNPDFTYDPHTDWYDASWGTSTYYSGWYLHSYGIALDPANSATTDLGQVLEIRQQQNGGGNVGATRVEQSMGNYPVDSATVIYGLFAPFFPGGSCCHDVGIGVHISSDHGDIGDLEYYYSNTNNEGAPDNWNGKTAKFIPINPGWSNYFTWVDNHPATYLGISDGTGAGRRLISDIIANYGNPSYQYYVTNIHLWAFVHSGLLEEDTLGKFKGISLGEYPSPTVTASKVTFTDPGYGLDTSTTITITGDGGIPLEGGYLFPTNGQFSASPVSFRGGISSYTVHVGSYSSSGSSWTVNYNDISRGVYTTSGTITCGDGYSNTGNGPTIVDGYAVQVTANWNGVSGASTTLHYKQLGDSTKTATVGSSTVTVLVDPGSTVSLDTPTKSGVTGTYARIASPNPTSWTNIQSSQTSTVNYYLQYECKLTTNGLSSNYPATVTALQLGTTNSPTTYATWEDWVDAGSKLNISDTITVTTNQQQYHTPNTVSWSVSSSDPTTEITKSISYYRQWKPSVTINGLSDPSNWVTATYTKDGSSASWNGINSWSDWVDNSYSLSFTINSHLSTASERWHTYSVRSWTVSSAFSGSVTYIHQYYLSLNPLDTSGNPLAKSVPVQYTGDDGSGSSNGTFTTSFSALWSRWMNAGSTLRNEKLASGSTVTDQWYSYDGTLNGNWRWRTVSSSTTYTLTFYHQFRPEIELYSGRYGTKIYDNAWWLSPFDWIQASAYLNESDSQPPIVGTYTFTFTDPSGVPHVVDGSATGSCFYQIPQARGAWTLCVTWDDGSGTVIYNKSVGFYVWDYDVGLQSLVQSGNNLNLTVYVNQLSGAMSTMQDYAYVVALTGSSSSGIYTNATGFTFANGFMSVGVSSVSTKFFFPAGMWIWKAHMINLDPYLAHVVGVRVLVVDPITGYMYANTTSTKSLSIGGEGDLQIQFTANTNWYKHGLFRVYYTFLLYDVSGGSLLASKTVDYGNSSPLSWIMRGTGEGEIKAVYYFTGLHNSTTLTQIPVSLLAPSTTARFYLAFEDSHALSTQSQINPAVMHYVNITFIGGNVFATGCVPQSAWVAEGDITLSVESPFYPKPPYYSSTTRFTFLGWKWTYASSYPQWVSCSSATLIVDVTQPIQVVAYWRTQYLIEYTPYVPTTAPTNTVEISYTVNATLTTMSVKSANTVRVWVDAYTLFTMHDLWVNDYTWYGVNYDTPSKNVTGGASLTLPYVEKTNKVSNTTVESNSFEAGGTLTLNLTLTTTYFNAQWINVTVMVASENAILVDRNGATWNNVRIQLQNNTALITIPLPEDIGNGTLTVILTAYGNVEPTTKQVTLHSPSAPPGRGQQQGGVDLMPIAVTVTSLGGLLGASLLIRKWRRASRQGSDRNTSNATPTTTTTAPATGLNFAPIIDSLSGAGIIEFHEQRGPHLKTIIDKDSKFLSKLRGDPGMCVRHHGTRPLVIQDPEGEHVALLTYTNKDRERGHETEQGIEARGSRSRTMKSTLVLCTKERGGADIMKLAEELSQLGNNRSIRLKLVSATRNRSPPPTWRNPNHG